MAKNQSNSGTPPGSSHKDNLRQNIANEMRPETVRCSFNDFLEHYMSFATEEALVDDILKILLPARKFEPDEDKNLTTSHINIVTKLDDTRKKSYYFLRGEMSSKDNETRYFEPLVEITKAIEDRMGRKPRYGYHHSPNCRIGGSTGSHNRCDAYFKSGDATSTQTRNIAVAFQLKKDSKRTYDNNSNLVSANVRIMNDDVRRRFAFGITVEGTLMRLWYFSRSHSAITEAEDYVANPKSLIKVFASFMYATEEEMGYDAEISIYREPTGEINYTYTITTKDTGAVSYYRTVSSIYEDRANRMTGRMVRIWKAVKVNSTTTPTPTTATYCVLKDVWLDCDAQTEQEIQQHLFADIEKFLDTPQKEDKKFEEFRQSLYPKRGTYRDYFLTIVDGSKGKPGKHTRATGLFKDSPTSDGASAPALSSGRQGLRGVPGPSGTPGPDDLAPRDFLPKMRCFSVVNEVFSAVDELDTLGEGIDIIEQTLTPLELMCGAGWVHRDISCGNILAHKDANGKWKVKLSDLEYAKRFPPAKNSRAHADPKTGTAFFMPFEILDGLYLFSHEAESVENSIEARLEDELAAPRNGNVSGIQRTYATYVKDPVLHSFAHDLESLYWLLLWIITCRIELPVPKNYFNTAVFTHDVLLSAERRLAFTKPISRDLSPILPSACTSDFVKEIEEIRGLLFGLCKGVRRKNSVNTPSSYVKMYGLFRASLQALSGTGSPGLDVKLVKRTVEERPRPRPSVQKGKRKASTAAKDDDDYQDEGAARKISRPTLHPNSGSGRTLRSRTRAP